MGGHLVGRNDDVCTGSLYILSVHAVCCNGCLYFQPPVVCLLVVPEHCVNTKEIAYDLLLFHFQANLGLLSLLLLDKGWLRGDGGHGKATDATEEAIDPALD